MTIASTAEDLITVEILVICSNAFQVFSNFSGIWEGAAKSENMEYVLPCESVPSNKTC